MAASVSDGTAAAALRRPEQPLHLLVVPFPAQGHMIPLLDLAHDLACRGVAVTVVVTPKNVPLVSPTLSRHRPAGAGPIRTLVIPFPAHPSIPDGVENVQELSPSYFFPMMHACGGLREAIYRWTLHSDGSVPSCRRDNEADAMAPAPSIDAIISDFFSGWTFHLAKDLGVPRIVFSPSGANTLAVVHWTWRNMPRRPPGSQDDPSYPIRFSGIPNSPSHPWYHTSRSYTTYLQKKGEPEAESVRDGFMANMASWGYVFHSFEALEAPYLQYMKDDMGHQRVWAVGPLGKEAADRGGRSSVATDEVLRWLDGCSEGSVVYACFGSQVVLRPPQIESIAAAFERSKAKFVWVVKEDLKQRSEEGLDVLAEFERRTGGRGVVIRGWAPQVTILRHRAVGWFLSHCGWNSVLEALAAGVALLAWPMGADQYFNARVLVDELGVAVKACQDPDTVPDPDVLAELIREAAAAADLSKLHSAEVLAYRKRRDKALELSDLAREAVRPGGSSYNDLDGLVEELRKLKFSN